MSKRALLTVVGLVVAIGGCDPDIELTPAPTGFDDSVPTTQTGEPVEVDQPAASNPAGEAPLFADESPPVVEPPVEEPVVEEPVAEPVVPLPRSRRRMDIDQLNQAIRQASGGLGWTETRGGREVDLFEELAETLGRPDYLDLTTENLEPALLFHKFLADAARAVCSQSVARDIWEGDGERPLLGDVDPTATYEDTPEAIDDNLARLLLRFHGRRVTDASDPALVSWRWLFRSATHVTEDPAVAWRTVCVGLITHPDFYSY